MSVYGLIKCYTMVVINSVSSWFSLMDPLVISIVWSTETLIGLFISWGGASSARINQHS